MATIGLTLSGGGARGIAHVGLLKAFDEAGIKISMITGTSAGAIVGAFYCYGYSPDEILQVVKAVKLYRYIRPALTKSGLLKMDPTEQIYKKYFSMDDFQYLKIPLVISATNLRTGKSAYFSHGSLIAAIKASSAVPVIFHPVHWNGEDYVDGGILNNLPIEPLVGHVDKIIGVNCNPIDGNYELGNFRSLIERSLLMAINVNAKFKRSECDLFLEPDGLKGFGGFDFSKAEEMFNIGYEYGISVVDKVKTLIEKDEEIL